MPVITEEMLRKLEKNGELATLKVTKKDIFTPSAKEFLSKKGIAILDEDKAAEVKENKVEEKTAVAESPSEKPEKPKRQYKDYITGAIYDKKPEYMTQIFGNDLVVKNHKRIILRGNFDRLQAETIRYWKKWEKNKKLEADFAQVYRFLRDLYISEIVDSEFQDRNVLGYDIDTLKEITHNTHKYYKTGHLFEINVEYDEAVIDVNCLRAMSRQCEISAVEAFYREGKTERNDILKALNRLSSIFYLMMLKANNGDYK